jgi:hypothetical protein
MVNIFFCLNEFQFFQLYIVRKKIQGRCIWLVQENNSNIIRLIESDFSTDLFISSNFRCLTSFSKVFRLIFKIKNRIKADYRFFTSYSYGFHFAVISKFYQIQWRNIFLIDDGLSTYVPIKTSNLIIKKIIYSLLGFVNYVPEEFILTFDSRIVNTIGLFNFSSPLFQDFHVMQKRMIIGNEFRNLILSKNNNFFYLNKDSIGLLLLPDFIPNSDKDLDFFYKNTISILEDLEVKYKMPFFLKAKYSNPSLLYFLSKGKVITDNDSVEFILSKYNISHIHTYINTTALLILYFNLPINLSIDWTYVTKDSHIEKIKLLFLNKNNSFY